MQLFFHLNATNLYTLCGGSMLSSITCLCTVVFQWTEEIIKFFPTPRYHGENKVQ